jgi:hypothetical protein
MLCISTDEFLHAAALKASSANQVEKVKKREALLKKQATQQKAKAVNTDGELTKSNLQLLLCWKLTEEEHNTFKVADPKKSMEELKLLWTKFKDREVLSDTALAASKNQLMDD